jgi:secondary thiamine-phosphate synthase enzyme
MIQTLALSTRQHSQLLDITTLIQDILTNSGIQTGLVTIYCPHTTAGLTINENADPTVRADILEALDRLVPWQANYRHPEGNAAAHIKATLVGSSVTVLIDKGQLMLGTWQGIYFCEFDGPRTRRVLLHISAP